MPRIEEFKSSVTHDMELDGLSELLPGELRVALNQLNKEVRYYNQGKNPFESYKKYPGVHFIAPSQQYTTHHQVWVDRRYLNWKDTLFHEVGHAIISDLGLPNFGWQHDSNNQIDRLNELIVSDLCDMLQDIWVEQYLETIAIDRENHKTEVGKALLDDTGIMAGTEGGYSLSDVVRICKRYVNARIQMGDAKFCGSPLREIYPLANNRFHGKQQGEVLRTLAELQQDLEELPESGKKPGLIDIVREALIYIHKEHTLDSVFHLLAKPYVAEKAVRTYQRVKMGFKYNVPTYGIVIPEIAAILGASQIIENK